MTEKTPENLLNSAENEALRQEHEAMISTPPAREAGVPRTVSTQAEKYGPLDHATAILGTEKPTPGTHREVPGMEMKDEIPTPERPETLLKLVTRSIESSKKIAGSNAEPGAANSLAEELERIHNSHNDLDKVA